MFVGLFLLMCCISENEYMSAAHMVCWVMSDRGEVNSIFVSTKADQKLGIPRSYRMMQGFGVNTFTLINDQGEQSFVKFHMIPELGVYSLVWDEALKINGEDPGKFFLMAAEVKLKLVSRFSQKRSQ